MNLRYTRRRYGRTTFTWVEIELDGVWYDLGDPWPCVTPPHREIAVAVEDLKALDSATRNRRRASA